MILIRGHRHLQECAYIGDDSSEELEELLEIASENGILNLAVEESSENPANRVELLRKRRPEVEFHDEKLRENAESFTFTPSHELAKDSDDNMSGKRMQALLNMLPHKANKFKANVAPNTTHNGKQVDRLINQLKIEIENRGRLQKAGAAATVVPPNINLSDFVRLHQADHVHMARETNVKNGENENIKFHKGNSEKSAEVNVNATSAEILASLSKQLGHLDAVRRNKILDELKKQHPETFLDIPKVDEMQSSPTNKTNSTVEEHPKSDEQKTTSTLRSEFLLLVV